MSGQDHKGGLSLCSWNTKGMGQLVKRRKILSTLKARKYDIVFLQETHLLELDNKKLRKDWVGQVFYSIGSSNSRGVAILVHKHLQFKSNKVFSDDQGRMVIVKAELEGHHLILANIYAPNLDDPAFFGMLEYRLGEIDDGHNYPIILGGDFNQVFDKDLDRSNAVNYKSRRAVEMVNNICRDLGLVDAWRLLKPTSRDYTFYSPCHRIYTRIDYFLISHSLLPSIVSCEIRPIIVSDHAEVTLLFLPFSNTRKSSRWRLNSSLLQDSNFRTLLQEQINFFKESNIPTAPSPSIAWETLKAFLRGFIIQHASHKKRERAAEICNLEKEVKIAENNFKACMSNENLAKVSKLKYDYNTLLSQKVEFSLFRARQKFFEEGDKAGRMLANYIKQQETHSAIPAVQDQQGTLHIDITEINNTFKDFYENLYKSESEAEQTEIESFLLDLNLPTLSLEQKEILDIPITVEEIVEIIQISIAQC